MVNCILRYLSTSHGKCSQVCYSPAFWTCGLACLAGAAWAALPARRVYAGAGHSGRTPPCRVFRRGFSGQPILQEWKGTPICGILVGQPRKGISSGYWKWSSKNEKSQIYQSENVFLMTGERLMVRKKTS